MPTELDPDLLKEFAEAREPPADDEFMVRVLAKIERARRARVWMQVLAASAVAIIVLLNLGAVLENTVAAVRLAGELSSSPGEMLITPWGGVLSMLVGAWVVYRTRPSRR